MIDDKSSAIFEKMNAIEEWRDKAASLSYALAFVISTVENEKNDSEKLAVLTDFLNKSMDAKFHFDLSDVIASDEMVNDRGEPEAIYLQLHGEQYERPADYKADITWCWYRIYHGDVRYIRQDISRQFAIPGQIPPKFRAWWTMVEGARDDAGTPFKDADIALDSGYGSQCSVTAGEIRKMLK